MDATRRKREGMRDQGEERGIREGERGEWRKKADLLFAQLSHGKPIHKQPRHHRHSRPGSNTTATNETVPNRRGYSQGRAGQGRVW